MKELGKYKGARERHREIFIDGMSGKTPLIPMNYEELERGAKAKMDFSSYAYVATGAGKGRGISNNAQAFNQYDIIPRMPNNVARISTSTKVLKQDWAWPALLSPVGVLCLAHGKADIAVADAASAMETVMTFSNQASVPMETCARHISSGFWFQLYHSSIPCLSESLISRAQNSGAQALVITLDTTRLGWRNMDLQNGYLPFLEGRGIAQYWSDPVFIEWVKKAERDTSLKPRINLRTIKKAFELRKRLGPIAKKQALGKDGAIKMVQQFIQHYARPHLDWDELDRLRQHCQLPIFLKGILHPEDAKQAIRHGFDGIVVSNHGGRQVDSVIPSLEALVNIKKVIPENYPLILDSGVRSGADVFKALALGATAVGIGRPYVYALALHGAQGIAELIANWRSEFELTMSLCGCDNIAQINSSYVKKV